MIEERANETAIHATNAFHKSDCPFRVTADTRSAIECNMVLTPILRMASAMVAVPRISCSGTCRNPESVFG